jgi:two-component system phosphate regulon sensor histidine kinase PhoR
MRANFRSRSHQIRKKLDYQNGKSAEIQVSFSQEEFRKPRLYILAAFAVSFILLVCLGWAGYGLYYTHSKLVLAEKTKEHMIYSITHDAKQDLSVIQGKISSLLPKVKNGSQPASLGKDLRLTMESAEAIERYLNNLKDQQGLTKGKIEIMREQVYLHEVIESAAEAFVEKMNLRQLTVALGHLEKNLEVFTDPQLVKRILMNLIHNAMKYSPAGGVISIWQETRQAQLLTYVRDQGQGIPQPDWERIFHPYVQLDTRREGMGLGLATARSLANILEGRLGVAESIVGQGTTMCLALPLAYG